MPGSACLVDRHGRRIDYLRVSVTDRCDLRCTYCLPADFKHFDAPAHWLDHAEMARLAGLFVGLGVRKLRLTGGEPLTRGGLPVLVRALAALPGLQDLSLSTNGTRLERHAAGFAPIKLNVVVQADTPEKELDLLLDYARRHGFILRLIEPMPVGRTGRGTTGIDLTELGRRLAARHGLVPSVAGSGAGPARYWSSAGQRLTLGVITPMSQHFCATCNRVRLGADGTLYLCLGQQDSVPLGAMLRQGASDARLAQAIVAAIAAKPERHDFNTHPERIVRFMSQTGG